MSTKILHTSDWHLGKKLFDQDRLEEQRLFLQWIVDIISKNEIDVLLVCGDIYDSPRPPDQAITLFFNFLSQVSQTDCRVFIIAGNHDSGHFLNAPNELLKEKNIHIFGQMEKDLTNAVIEIPLNGSNKTFSLTPLPYFRSHELINLKNQLNLDDDSTLTDVLKEYLNRLSQKRSQKSVHHILMGHHLYGDFEYSGSEQVVSLSGIDSLSCQMFSQYFDYLALGHIHKKQVVSASCPVAIYPGSPIPLRFSESQHKFVSLIDMTATKLTWEWLEIPVWRAIKNIKTSPGQWSADLEKYAAALLSTQYQLNPWVQITLKMNEFTPGLVDQIKLKCEELQLKLISFYPLIGAALATPATREKNDFHQLSTEELFAMFYQHKFPNSKGPSLEILKQFREIVQDLDNEETMDEVES